MIVIVKDATYVSRPDIDMWECPKNKVNSSIYSKIISLIASEVMDKQHSKTIADHITKKLIGLLDKEMATGREYRNSTELGEAVTNVLGVQFQVINCHSKKTMAMAANELNMIKLKLELT